jgi:hypothetical protein
MSSPLYTVCTVYKQRDRDTQRRIERDEGGDIHRIKKRVGFFLLMKICNSN